MHDHFCDYGHFFCFWDFHVVPLLQPTLVRLCWSKSSSSHRQIHWGRGPNYRSLVCDKHTLPLDYHARRSQGVSSVEGWGVEREDGGIEIKTVGGRWTLEWWGVAKENQIPIIKTHPSHHKYMSPQNCFGESHI